MSGSSRSLGDIDASRGQQGSQEDNDKNVENSLELTSDAGKEMAPFFGRPDISTDLDKRSPDLLDP